jgi:membrane protease YdiL (CAAX protease family)
MTLVQVVRRFPLLFTTCCLAIAVVLLNIGAQLSDLFDPADNIVLDGGLTIGRAMITAFCIGLLIHLRGHHVLWPIKSTPISDRVLLTLVTVYAMIVHAWGMYPPESRVGLTSDYLIKNVLNNFFVGASEELLFRGIILLTLYEAFFIRENAHGNKSEATVQKAAIQAIILSALAFGLLHIVSIFYDQNLFELSLVTVIVAFFWGVFLGVVTLKSQSIWPALVFHWLVNTFANFWPAGSSQEMLSWYQPWNLLLWNIPISILGITLLWKRDSFSSLASKRFFPN